MAAGGPWARSKLPITDNDVTLTFFIINNTMSTVCFIRPLVLGWMHPQGVHFTFSLCFYDGMLSLVEVPPGSLGVGYKGWGKRTRIVMVMCRR